MKESNCKECYYVRFWKHSATGVKSLYCIERKGFLASANSFLSCEYFKDRGAYKFMEL